MPIILNNCFLFWIIQKAYVTLWQKNLKYILKIKKQTTLWMQADNFFFFSFLIFPVEKLSVVFNWTFLEA